MPKLVIVSCLMLFWAFYEASGGADFAPRERPIALTKAKAEIAPEPVPEIDKTVIIAAPEEAVVAPEQVVSVVPASYRSEPVLISSATPRDVAATVEEDIPAATDLWLVAGDRVNMRDGPSTSFGVLDTLTRGTKAEIIDRDGQGWARIRLVESGKIGWMAERLLAKS